MYKSRYAMKGRETTEVPMGPLPTLTLEDQSMKPEIHPVDIPIKVEEKVEESPKPVKDRKKRAVRSEITLEAMGVLGAKLSRFPSARPGADYKDRDNYQHREFFTDQMAIALAESFEDMEHLRGCTHILSIPSEHLAYDLGPHEMLEPYLRFTKTSLKPTERESLAQRLAYGMPAEAVQEALDKDGRTYAEAHKFCVFNQPSLMVYTAKFPSLDTLLKAALPDDGDVAIHSNDAHIVAQVVEKALAERRRPSQEVIDLEKHSIEAGEKTFYFVGPAKKLFEGYVTSPRSRSGWSDIDLILMNMRS